MVCAFTFMGLAYLIKMLAPPGANTALTLSPGASAPLAVTRRCVHRPGFSHSGKDVRERPGKAKSVPPSLKTGGCGTPWADTRMMAVSVRVPFGAAGENA
jgi:hypothetical protein